MITQLTNYLNTQLGIDYHIFESNNENKTSSAKYQGIIRRVNTINSNTNEKISLVIEEFNISFEILKTKAISVRNALDILVSNTQAYDYNDEALNKRFLLTWSGLSEEGESYLVKTNECTTISIRGSIAITTAIFNSNNLEVKICDTAGGTYLQLKGILDFEIANDINLSQKANLNASVNILEPSLYGRSILITGFLLNDTAHAKLLERINTPIKMKDKLYFDINFNNLIDCTIGGYIKIGYKLINNNYATFSLTVSESG